MEGSASALADKLASLFPSSSSSSPEKPKFKSKPEPKPKLMFVLAFDESAVLSEREESGGLPPLLFSLRRQLHLVKEVPFFALFLTTTGHIAPFLSGHGLDQSMGIRFGKLESSPAFSGCVFDALNSESVAFVEGEMTVRQAASEWTMMHLGRPL